MMNMADALERRCVSAAPWFPTSTFCSRCGAAAEKVGSDDDEGSRSQIRNAFAGEIAIDREVGRGSMAVVYVGFDVVARGRVAISVACQTIRPIPDHRSLQARGENGRGAEPSEVIPIYGLRNSATGECAFMQFVDGIVFDVVLR